MTDTGRFQELSPTKLQEILDNAVPEKTKKAHSSAWTYLMVRIWEF